MALIKEIVFSIDSLIITDTKCVSVSRVLEFFSPLQVPSDGDCLFASIAHQLEVHGLVERLKDVCREFKVNFPDPPDVKSVVRCLRFVATAVMRRNSDDFLPFICAESDVDGGSTEGSLKMILNSTLFVR